MYINVLASSSKGNCYQVSDGQTSVLLDAGIPFNKIQQLLDFKVSSIKGVLITHCHQDHSKACKDLAHKGIDIYSSKGTFDECQLAGHRFKVVEPKQVFAIGTFIVVPFDVQHDAPEPLGFVIKSTVTGEKLLYFTDTFYLKYTFPGLNYIMGECNYSDESMNPNINRALKNRVIESHMSLKHFLELLQANDLSQVKAIYLLHLSDGNSDEELFKSEVQKLTGTQVYVC